MHNLNHKHPTRPGFELSTFEFPDPDQMSHRGRPLPVVHVGLSVIVFSVLYMLPVF